MICDLWCTKWHGNRLTRWWPQFRDIVSPRQRKRELKSPAVIHIFIVANHSDSVLSLSTGHPEHPKFGTVTSTLRHGFGRSLHLIVLLYVGVIEPLRYTCRWLLC
jgi:hypothetical protein